MNIKKRPSWYVAATHYLTAGFVVPLVGGFLLGLIIVPLQLPFVVLEGIMIVAYALLAYFGVMYSSRYIQKAYVISDPQSVVRLSTVYVIVGIAVSYLVALAGHTLVYSPETAFAVTSKLLYIIVFYIASKRFIKTTI